MIMNSGSLAAPYGVQPMKPDEEKKVKVAAHLPCLGGGNVLEIISVD